MVSFVIRFVVQDRESKLFLMPQNGDVGYTEFLHEAGRFDLLAEAIDTASLNCGEGFNVTKVLG